MISLCDKSDFNKGQFCSVSYMKRDYPGAIVLHFAGERQVAVWTADGDGLIVSESDVKLQTTAVPYDANTGTPIWAAGILCPDNYLFLLLM